MKSPLEKVLERLTGAKESSNGRTACCPGHDDRQPSLSVREQDDGRVLLHCFSGCGIEAICDGMGLSLADLFDGSSDTMSTQPSKTREKRGFRRHERESCEKPEFAELDEAIRAAEERLGPVSHRYDYHDQTNALVGVVLRWDRADGKTFRPISWHDGAWRPMGTAAPRPLYRLHDLESAETVYVVEGEKAVEAANSLGLIATTSPHGAQSPEKADWSPLAGVNVVILPDNDVSGGKYAERVCEQLAKLNPVPVVRVHKLPYLSEKGDLVDWMDSQSDSTPKELRNMLEELVESAEPTPLISKPLRKHRRSHGEQDAVEQRGSANDGNASILWTDPEELPNELPPVLPFDLGLLPSVLASWVGDISERLQCPLDFSAVATMVMLAGVVGRRVTIRPKELDDWVVFPNLWGAVVGRPGVMKTPAILEPLRMLQKLESQAREEFDFNSLEHQADQIVRKAREKDVEQQVRTALKKGDVDIKDLVRQFLQEKSAEPVCQRYVVNDATVEKLGELLNQNPNALVVFRDELTGWLHSLDREGQETARAFYLEAWYGSGQFTYDRIGRGTLHIQTAMVSVIGAIQPGPLSEYLAGAARHGKADDGLMQRLQLAVWPDVGTKWKNVDRKPNYVVRDAVWNLLIQISTSEFEWLPANDGGFRYVHFSASAQELFNEWQESNELRVRTRTLHSAMESHLAKFRSLLPTLALLIQVAETPDLECVEREATLKAIAWTQYLESHANRMYSSEIYGGMQSAKALATKLKNGALANGFALRDVYRSQWSLLRTRDEAVQACDILEDLRWICPSTEVTGGRDRIRYWINPKILECAVPATDKTDKGTADGPFVSFGGEQVEVFSNPDSEWGGGDLSRPPSDTRPSGRSPAGRGQKPLLPSTFTPARVDSGDPAAQARPALASGADNYDGGGQRIGHFGTAKAKLQGAAAASR